MEFLDKKRDKVNKFYSSVTSRESKRKPRVKKNICKWSRMEELSGERIWMR